MKLCNLGAKRLATIGGTLLALGTSSVTAAEEEGWWVGGSLTATSDYVLRGVSQTDEGPALQASIDFGHSNGFYAGAWASNVDFDQPDGIDMEVDLYVGWVFGFENGTELDLSFVRYLYPGNRPGFDIDYNEVITTFSFANYYSATLVYSNDYLNTGEAIMLYQFGAEAPIGSSDVNVKVAAGYNDISNAAGSEYWDFQVGVNRAWGAFSVDLSYFDTSGYDADIQAFLGPKKWADGRIVLSIGVEF